MRDVFYDWFDDERAPRPVSKTPPARLAARRKLLDSLLVEIASADDPLPRHHDASQRERRRVAAQGDPLQYA